MNRGVKWALSLLVVTTLTATAGGQAGQDDVGKENAELPATVFAIVGDETITVEQYQVNLHASIRQRFYHGNVPQEKLAALRDEVGRQLIDRVLLHQEAKRRDIKPDEAWVKQRVEEITQQYRSNPQWEEKKATLLNSLREQLTEDSMLSRLESDIKQVAAPSKEEIRQYYNAHKEKFTTPERIRVSIILLKVEPWSPDTAWQAAADEAKNLIKQLRENGGKNFAELARLRSGDDSASRGGDLGYVHKGMLTDEAQQVLDRMNIGDISEPVQLLKGIAIFRLDERVQPVVNTFDNSEERARGLLTREKGEVAWENFLAKLRANTQIRVNESVL